MEAGAVAVVIKHVHVWLVVLSVGGFAVRYMMSQQRGRSRPQTKLVRIAPHIVDTLLVASGIGLAWLLGLPLFQVTWLTAKLGLILAYIVLGVVALLPSLSRGARRAAGLAAFACALGIVFLSVYKPGL